MNADEIELSRLSCVRQSVPNYPNLRRYYVMYDNEQELILRLPSSSKSWRACDVIAIPITEIKFLAVLDHIDSLFSNPEVPQLKVQKHLYFTEKHTESGYVHIRGYHEKQYIRIRALSASNGSYIYEISSL